MASSPDQSLNPSSQAALLSLKKEVRRILIKIRSVDPQSDLYQQYASEYDKLKDLYSELNLLDLTPKEVKPIEFKTPREERKERRKERREARKEKRAERRKKRKEKRAKRKEERQKQRELGKEDDGVFTEAKERFAALMKKWKETPLDEILEDIDQFLDKAEVFLSDANFLALANQVTVESWMKRFHKLKLDSKS